MDLADYLKTTEQVVQQPSLGFLNQLIERHQTYFPFSSANVLLGRDLSLSDEPLFERVIRRQSGGYCFEHNKIFFSVLEQLGFSVRNLMARITYNGPLTNPRTHRITLLTLDGEDYLVDVGFGPLSPFGAIKLSATVPTNLSDSSFRVVRQEDEFYLQVLKEEGFFTLYVFDLARYTEKDCNLGHFFSHQYSEAVFVNNLIVSKIEQGRVRHIRNTEFFTVTASGTEVQFIEDAPQLAAVLRDHFSMIFSEEEVGLLYEKAMSKAQGS